MSRVATVEYDGLRYTWDLERNQRIFILNADLHIVTELEREPVRKKDVFGTSNVHTLPASALWVSRVGPSACPQSLACASLTVWG
jgi:hypothetical protein